MLVVIFGPQTRLARTLLTPSWMQEQTVMLLVRNQPEADRLSIVYPRATLLPTEATSVDMPEEKTAVGILCCAFGVIHPTIPDPENDMAIARRDLHLLRQLLLRYEEVPIHVVFVSSVLALSPQPRRAYYAGWKNILCATATHLVQHHPHGVFSAFYPGRLIERRDCARPTSLLYTSYRRLARELIDAVRLGTPRRRVVGLDARLWLAARMLANSRVAAAGRL